MGQGVARQGGGVVGIGGDFTWRVDALRPVSRQVLVDGQKSRWIAQEEMLKRRVLEPRRVGHRVSHKNLAIAAVIGNAVLGRQITVERGVQDRKSTRLNSSH